MKFRRGRQTEPGINLTPLIDILFIVLVFLVLTTTFHESTRLRVKLPEASTGEEARRAAPGNVVVTVAEDGQIYLSERAVTLPRLQELLETLPDRDDAQMLLAADEQVEHGRVVEVMDLARRIGIVRVSIETLRADRSPRD